MKAFGNLSKGIVLSAFLSGLATACVNKITEETSDVSDNTTTPLKFIADIQGVTNARVNGTAFEVGDEVGLFALAGIATMKEERYADNLCFVRSAEGEFESEESMYFPDDGAKLNLISYYPYQEDGVDMGESTMQVMVASEQNIPANYFHSDFLIASKENLAATNEPVSLTYKHKFFKLKIALKPDEGEDIEKLLAADPQLSVSGFFSKTSYDFQEDSYSDYSEEKDIIPAGGWKEEGDRLVGKQLILIPQEMTEGDQYITLEVDDKTYTSLLPSTLILQNGKQRELEITFKSAEDVLMGDMKGEIVDWEGTETDCTESVIVRKYIDISKLAFESSNVYKVNHAGKQVAEICKEYLVTPGFSSQAIVVYPMKPDGSVVDLSEGKVVKLLGQSEKVHGGGVSWNVENHSLTYTPGTSAVRNYVSILADGQVSLSISMVDEALPVLALSDVVRDVRGGVTHNYPVVKIGTQYWMRTNLEATQYLDGKVIPKLETMSKGGIGYLLSKAGNYYYSANAVLNHPLSPAGWEIPCWENWDILKGYLEGDASLLKSGRWIPITIESKPSIVADVNNRSGFNALPVGMYSQKYLPEAYEGRYLSYWTLDPSGAAMDGKIFKLRADNNEMAQGNTGAEQAFPIRCVRK